MSLEGPGPDIVVRRNFYLTTDLGSVNGQPADDADECPFVISLDGHHRHDDDGHTFPVTREQLGALRDQINAVLA